MSLTKQPKQPLRTPQPVLTRPPQPVLTRPPRPVLTRPPQPVFTRPPQSVLTRPPQPVLTRPPLQNKIQISDEKIINIFDKNSRLLVDSLPNKFVLLFYPDITRALINIVSTLDENKLKVIFPENVNLIRSINEEVAIILTQMTNNHIKNMFITQPFINITDVKNQNIYPLKKSDYSLYLSKLEVFMTEKQFSELLNLLSDEQIKFLLSTLLLYQKRNILSLVPENKVKFVETYGVF